MPSRLIRYDQPGHTHFWTISCYRRLQFFHDDGVKQVVIKAFEEIRQEFGVCLIGYVIMPEHLHCLIYPHAKNSQVPSPIGQVLQCFKQYIGRFGKNRLRDVWRTRGRLWSAPLNAWAEGVFAKQEIMNTRGYDRNIFAHRALLQKLDYCHKNPLTRGLVNDAADWPWSSYRFYEFGDRSVLSMDWDGTWPIRW